MKLNGWTAAVALSSSLVDGQEENVHHRRPLDSIPARESSCSSFRNNCCVFQLEGIKSTPAAVSATAAGCLMQYSGHGLAW